MKPKNCDFPILETVPERGRSSENTIFEHNTVNRCVKTCYITQYSVSVSTICGNHKMPT